MKKVLSVILALCLMFTFTVTAFAESTPDQVAPSVSDDATIQAAWDALNAIDEAINNADYDAMMAAEDNLYNIIETMSDEQIGKWGELIEEKMGFEAYMDLIFKIIYVENVKLFMDEYLADTSSVNAYWFVDSYDFAKEENLPISQMFDGIDEVYAQALADMPSEKIIKIHDAYMMVSDAIWGPWVEDFDAAIAAFEAVLDDFNNLTDEEMDELALLIGAESAEEAYNWILTDWINLNIADTMVQYYNEFIANPNEDTALAFVEYYDAIFDGDDEELKEIIIWCFDEDIEEVYKEAKALLGEEVKDDDEYGSAAGGSSAPQSPVQSSKDDESVNVNSASVKTGADSVVVMGLSLVILMMGVALFMRKKAR